MCNCIKKQEESAAKIIQDNKLGAGEVFVKGEIVDAMLLFGVKDGVQTATHYEYNIARQKNGVLTKIKTPKKIAILHRFCPFCGKPYDNTSTLKPLKK